jgi:hypothetical protein
MGQKGYKIVQTLTKNLHEISKIIKKIGGWGILLLHSSHEENLCHLSKI